MTVRFNLVSIGQNLKDSECFFHRKLK